MRKLIFFILIFCSAVMLQAATINIVTATNTAATTATIAATTSMFEKNTQHEEKYHNGPTTYIVDTVQIWNKNKSIYTIETYEKRFYYYAKDPRQCYIDTETIYLGERKATPEEVKNYINDLFILRIFFVIMLIILAVVIVLGLSYNKRSKSHIRMEDE